MKPAYVDVDGEGNVRIPAEVARKAGLAPGSRAKVTQFGDRLVLHRPVTHLARVYIEPTTACNLDCRTCMRHVWDEPIAHMTWSTFARVLEGLEASDPRPTVFFGGLGEPLTHPEFLRMVRQVKELGLQVEAITNGILLDEARSTTLLEAGLDTLWVSIDGASPECYVDVRTEGDLPQVMTNLERLRDIKLRRRSETPNIGIAFVAMRRNLAELGDVLKLEHRVGARKFLVTNVYPHTAELLDEVLYRRSIGETLWSPATIRLARMDSDPKVAQILENVIQGLYAPRLDGAEILWPSDTCPFVSRGSTCVRWDGQVSPCLPLLHTHTSYLESRLRTTSACSMGSLQERGLRDIWMSPEYVALRERLDGFDFSPCTACNSCEKADANREDCFGNSTPTCGGCLWAQGFIQCP